MNQQLETTPKKARPLAIYNNLSALSATSPTLYVPPSVNNPSANNQVTANTPPASVSNASKISVSSELPLILGFAPDSIVIFNKHSYYYNHYVCEIS